MGKYRFFTQFQKKSYVLAFLSFKRQYDNIREKPEDNSTTWQKLKLAVTRDDQENLRPEMATVLSNVTGSLLVGFCVGGMKNIRFNVTEYIERNQATTYHNTKDAKFRLQDYIIANFLRDGARMSFRIMFFVGLFTIFYSAIGIMRDNHSVLNLIPAGILMGSICKIPMGLKGMVAGGVVGGFLSLVGSGVIYVILTSTGHSFKESFQWNYDLVNRREKKVEECRKSVREKKQELILLKKSGTVNDLTDKNID